MLERFVLYCLGGLTLAVGLLCGLATGRLVQEAEERKRLRSAKAASQGRALEFAAQQLDGLSNRLRIGALAIAAALVMSAWEFSLVWGLVVALWYLSLSLFAIWWIQRSASQLAAVSLVLIALFAWGWVADRVSASERPWAVIFALWSIAGTLEAVVVTRRYGQVLRGSAQPIVPAEAPKAARR